MSKEVNSNKEKGDSDIVVVGIISRTSEGKEEYLMVSSNKDYGEYTGFYYPPGGHVKEGEEVQKALARELKEELNIDVVVEKEIAETGGDVKKQVTHWWSCSAKSGEFDIQDEHIADARWMTKDDIVRSDRVWPATKKFFVEHI
jgi:8-oxo-dGTP diphosphatase